MATLKMVSPWVNLYHEINAFFKKDPNVTVVYDEEETEVKLYVNGSEKAKALTELLPASRKFGNVTLKVTVIPENEDHSCAYYKPAVRYHSNSGYREAAAEEPFTAAFRGNPIFSFANSVNLQTNRIVYVVFKNEVVQYYNDDLGDYYGQCSTLYQNIADDIFKPIDSVHYCTDKPRYDDNEF